MFEIKNMKKDDLEGICFIEERVFKNPWSIVTLEYMLKAPEQYLTFVLFKNKKVVGYLFYLLILDEAELVRIAIHPSHQGGGLAFFLLNYTWSLLKSHKIYRVFLEVHEANEKAKRLYERAGFNFVTRRRQYYGDGDAIIYKKEVTHECNNISH